MKKVLQNVLPSILATILMASSAFALALGTNITIPDGVSNLQDWHGMDEDGEVEPGCEHGQKWDLEGFFLDGSMLTMVGGFDFKNGIQGELKSDMFIDIDGDAEYGTANYGSQGGYQTIQDNFGYEYAIRFNFLDSFGGNYELYGLTNNATGAVAATTSVYYDQNEESNPLKYESGGTSLTGGNFNYYSGLTSSQVGGLSGWKHNAISLNLASILTTAELDNFMVHYTMYCGNDNLMGEYSAAPVPEPASILLFGVGLAGLAAFTRRKLNINN